jgi:hypothetical protein
VAESVDVNADVDVGVGVGVDLDGDVEIQHSTAQHITARSSAGLLSTP